MWKNERGSALLTVMVMLLIFTVLGLVLMAASINGAKRTEIREEEVTGNIEALTNLKEGVARIQSFIAEENAAAGGLPKQDRLQYDSTIQQFVDDMNKDHSQRFTIDNITAKAELDSSQTRAFLVSSPPYTQKVYITAMPSFLKYAAGSRRTLTINGSLTVDGGIYARDALFISNNANYIYHDTTRTVKTELPAIVDISDVTVEGKDLFLCKSVSPCYEDNHKRIPTAWNKVLTPIDAFSHGTAAYNMTDSEFIDVDLYQTFVEKLHGNGFSKSDFDRDMDQGTIQAKLTGKYRSVAGLKIIESFDELNNSQQNNDNQRATGYYFEGDAYVDTNNITLGKNDWLIINGDAYFENAGSTPMTIRANILVTGQVKISGELSLASVLYSLGDTTLNNVDINGQTGQENNRPSFILLTDGELEIARINKFDDSQNEEQVINGFLYTTKNADIYGVGSLVKVNGGIFSNDDLVLNAYRGNVAEDGAKLLFTPKSNHEDSRMNVVNNKFLFLDQLHALPKVDRLGTVEDKIEMKQP